MSFNRPSILTTLHLLIAGVLLLALVGCDGSATRQSPAQTSAAQDQAAPSETAPDHLTLPPRDPRAAIAEALDAGLLADQPTPNDKLRALLKVAGIPEASQVLVFSKTSLQNRLIGPKNPRAIYFSDDCYVGYVPGGLIEFADTDPDPDVVSGFFAIDPSLDARAQLQPDRSCLSCHDSSRTNYRPGLLIRSVFPDPQGQMILSAGSTVVGHDTPIDKRWGGWYVTGQTGQTHHRGNQVTIEQAGGSAYINNELGSNVTDLSPHFNTDRYLTDTSDVVALMVLEHQVQMHNLLTQGSASVNEQIQRSRSLAEHLDEPFKPADNHTLQRVISANADRIVKHLLFTDEVALTDPVVGSAAFIEQFRANRKEDSQGRSLKDFDLQTRLFKYRCSYMVYARAFELMPDLLKDAVLTKLQRVLQGRDDDEAFDHLAEPERSAIHAILQETDVLPQSAVLTESDAIAK